MPSILWRGPRRVRAKPTLKERESVFGWEAGEASREGAARETESRAGGTGGAQPTGGQTQPKQAQPEEREGGAGAGSRAIPRVEPWLRPPHPAEFRNYVETAVYEGRGMRLRDLVDEGVLSYSEAMEIAREVLKARRKELIDKFVEWAERNGYEVNEADAAELNSEYLKKYCKEHPYAVLVAGDQVAVCYEGSPATGVALPTETYSELTGILDLPVSYIKEKYGVDVLSRETSTGITVGEELILRKLASKATLLASQLPLNPGLRANLKAEVRRACEKLGGDVDECMDRILSRLREEYPQLFTPDKAPIWGGSVPEGYEVGSREELLKIKAKTDEDVRRSLEELARLHAREYQWMGEAEIIDKTDIVVNKDNPEAACQGLGEGLKVVKTANAVVTCKDGRLVAASYIA